MLLSTAMNTGRFPEAATALRLRKLGTGSNLISNSAEVQGFVWDSAYDVYYIAFNDYLFKIGAGLDGGTEAGKLLNYYSFHTGREFEGLGSYKGELYVNLNHPTETLKNHITK